MVQFILSFILLFNTSDFADPCEIYGSVCFVKSQYNAHYVVYVENGDDAADLAVFKEDNKLMADEEGIWYVTESEAFAKYKIFITKERTRADFTIEYIEERAFAGCP